jgi:DNA (cytosine-5)-methyltransferase 1
MKAYYNEVDRFCCDWLSNLMDAELITPGKIDDRSIHDVKPSDLAGYDRAHFFAGIGGWDYALSLACWVEPVWTGSCPCQPFSLAGNRKGFADDRHLWPIWRELIALGRPAKVFGEQVASASRWLRLVRGDLEALGYAVGAIPCEAASAGADHLRDRYWFVADANGAAIRIEPRRSGGPRGSGAREHNDDHQDDVEYASGIAEREPHDESDAVADRWQAWPVSGGAGDYEWVIGADGKARRVKPGVRLLAHGIPNRVGLLRGFGNAIDPRPAAAFIKAAMMAFHKEGSRL